MGGSSISLMVPQERAQGSKTSVIILWAVQTLPDFGNISVNDIFNADF